MRVQSFNLIPLPPLVALWLAYALLGWYLSASHIFWYVGALVAAIALAVSWKSMTWLDQLVKISSQSLLLILTILILTVVLILAATWSTLVPLIVIPLATTYLASVEMRFAGFSKVNTFWVLAFIAGIGLVCGEVIDLRFLSSHRY